MKRILEIDNAAFLLPDGVDAEEAARVLRRSRCIGWMIRKDGNGQTRIDMEISGAPRVCVTVIAAGVELRVQERMYEDGEGFGRWTRMTVTTEKPLANAEEKNPEGGG